MFLVSPESIVKVRFAVISRFVHTIVIYSYTEIRYTEIYLLIFASGLRKTVLLFPVFLL